MFDSKESDYRLYYSTGTNEYAVEDIPQPNPETQEVCRFPLLLCSH